MTNYFYSSENQLTGFKVYQATQGSFDPSQLWTPSSSVVKEVAYTYDALGRRIQKVVLDHSAASDPAKSFTKRYVYNSREVLLEYDGNNRLLARHTHSELKTDSVLATEVTPLGMTQKLAQTAGVYTYLKDSHGSIVDVVDTAGNRLQHYVYSAFGVLLGIQDALAQDITPSPALSPNYLFAGRELDIESGLYYNRARYLDASLGRFLQKDPDPGLLSVPISVVNGYIYAANNPSTNSDPSGRNFWGSLISFALDPVLQLNAAFAGTFGGGIGKQFQDFVSSDTFRTFEIGIAASVAGMFTGGLTTSAFIGATGGAAAGATVGGLGYAVGGYGPWWEGAIIGGISGGLAGYSAASSAAKAANGQSLTRATPIDDLREPWPSPSANPGKCATPERYYDLIEQGNPPSLLNVVKPFIKCMIASIKIEVTLSVDDDFA